MPRLSSLVERIMGRLGNYPGMSFLHSWSTSAKAAQKRFSQRVGDYGAYVNNAKMIGDDLQEARGGSAGGGVQDSVVDEDEDSIYPQRAADFVEDYYDLYEGDDGLNPESSVGNLRVDDYPDNDDDVAYYDDDYHGSR